MTSPYRSDANILARTAAAAQAVAESMRAWAERVAESARLDKARNPYRELRKVRQRLELQAERRFQAAESRLWQDES